MMTLDLMGGYGRADEQLAIQEAAAAGLRGMEHLISQLSRAGTGDLPPSPSPGAAAAQPQKHPEQVQQRQVDCREVTDMTVSKFRKVISILNRTGHARFRRGPAVAPQSSAAEPPAARTARPVTLDFTRSASGYGGGRDSAGFSVSGASSSFFSSVTTGDGSVSNGRGGGGGGGSASLMVVPPAAGAGSCGKLPLSSSGGSGQKRRCHEHAHSEDVAGGKYGANGGRCHCSKRRKHRVKRTIRVPAISPKVADIPADEYSWRKYGQKPIKGSPYPRGYYKCSTVRGCPARKHVERDPGEPSMLIVTYEGEHRHSAAGQDQNPPPLAPLPELPNH